MAGKIITLVIASILIYLGIRARKTESENRLQKYLQSIEKDKER